MKERCRHCSAIVPPFKATTSRGPISFDYVPRNKNASTDKQHRDLPRPDRFAVSWTWSTYAKLSSLVKILQPGICSCPHWSESVVPYSLLAPLIHLMCTCCAHWLICQAMIEGT